MLCACHGKSVRKPYFLTTSHNEKTPKEALWFAFYNAVLPDDLDDELNAVVIVVDSDSLAMACKAWVTENQE